MKVKRSRSPDCIKHRHEMRDNSGLICIEHHHSAVRHVTSQYAGTIHRGVRSKQYSQRFFLLMSLACQAGVNIMSCGMQCVRAAG